MSEKLVSARAYCDRCSRPVSHCLCAHVSVVASRTRILILQHPEEQKHALNTGRLAVLGLENAELLVGEHFPQLEAIVAAAACGFLLFPGETATTTQQLAAARCGVPSLLIVPDGTWRKARKILYANPVLQRMPRLALPAGAASEYRIRKTRTVAAVSTIEAIVRTLSVLEPDRDFEAVLKPFTALIDQQIQAMGPELYQRHHSLP